MSRGDYNYAVPRPNRLSMCQANIRANSQEELQRAFDTMVHGPINLTRAALPRFRERGSGWLVYMNSQSGFVGEPGATAYCAPKFAIEGEFLTSPVFLHAVP